MGGQRTLRQRPLADAAHVIVRVGAGVLFMQHGAQKLLGLLGGRPVPLVSLMGLAGVLELVGGALLVLGLLARPVAAVLVVEMTVAFVKAHLPRGGWPIQNGGELPLLFALVFVYLAANGAGTLSVDAWLRRRRRPAMARIGITRRRSAAA